MAEVRIFLMVNETRSALLRNCPGLPEYLIQIRSSFHRDQLACQEIPDVGQGGSDGYVVLGHFADMNIIYVFRERRQFFNILTDTGKVCVIQARSQIAAEDKILIIEQMHIIDGKRQVIQVGSPALHHSRITGLFFLKESVLLVLSEKCVHGADCLDAALPAAVAFLTVRNDLDMLYGTGISMLAGKNLPVMDNRRSKMDADIHIDEVR